MGDTSISTQQVGDSRCCRLRRKERKKERKGAGKFSNYTRKPSAVARIHYHPRPFLPAVYKKRVHILGEKVLLLHL